MANNTLSADSIVQLLPEYLMIETKYAVRKYGVRTNPQRTIFNNGLSPGGEAYQEYYRYFGAWKLFTSQTEGDPKALLLASQASLKLLNVSRATLCFSLIPQLGLSLVDSNNKAIGMLCDELGTGDEIDELDNPDFEEFEYEMLEPSLSDMAQAAQDDNIPELIVLTVELFKAQAQLVIGHVASHGQIATPGMPSGDVMAWDLQK